MHQLVDNQLVLLCVILLRITEENEYEIGTPLFSEIQMHLDNGKTFTVLAPGVSRENIYIQSVKVNGQPYDKSYITHRQIMDGATVEFEMGPEPGNIWYR